VIQSSGIVDESIDHSSVRRQRFVRDARVWQEDGTRQDIADDAAFQSKHAFLNKADAGALRNDHHDESCQFELDSTTSSAGASAVSDFTSWLYPAPDMLVEETGSYNKDLPYEIPESLMANIPLESLASQKSRTKPLVDRSPSTFTNRYKCKDEPAITRAFEAIDNQTQRTGQRITKTAVERSFKDLWVGLKFTIAQQRATMSVHSDHHGIVGHWRYYERQWWGTQLEALLNDLLREVELPDMEFAVSMLDGSPTRDPQVGVLKAEGIVGQDLLMIPRSMLFDWGEQVRKLAAAYKQTPCKHRKKMAVWRGATTGGANKFLNATGGKDFKLSGFSGGTLPRFQLVEFSRKHPELLDAAFTQAVQVDRAEDFENYMTEHGFMKRRLDDDAQRCYSAAVVIDGNTGADRLPRQLAYGIPIVIIHNKTLTSGDVYWYDELRAGVDYVPATQETLQQTLEKLLNDENLQKCIGENGRHYVETALTEGRMKCYMHTLLQEYAKRYRAGFR
jgi:hypothetical protein